MSELDFFASVNRVDRGKAVVARIMGDDRPIYRDAGIAARVKFANPC